MAEDTNHISTSNEVNEPAEDKSTDLSEKKPLAAKKRVVKVPHYLRPSTGSCHDKCKYHNHTPHESKEKPWRAVRRTSNPLPKTEKPVEIQIFVNTNPKKSDNAPSTSNTLKSHLSSKKSVVRENSMTSPSQSPRLVKKAIQSPLRASLPSLSKFKRQESATGSKKYVLSKPKALNPTLNVSARNSRPILSTFEPSSSSVEKELSNHPRSPSMTVRKAGIPASTALSLRKPPRLDTKKPVNTTEATISVSSSRVKAVKPSISQKNQRIVQNSELTQPTVEAVEEKTLHMIETEKDCSVSTHFIQSPSPLSPESLKSSSQANSDSFTAEEIDTDADDAISSYKRNTRTPNIELDQEKACMKLHFRRGTVIEIEPETNATRRMKFKEGVTLGRDDPDSNSGSKMKNFKKTGENERKDTDKKQVKVSLKHSEMVAKDEEVSVNNVIKETACKLAEKRKSKVKALVGAFETVILLQERKPAVVRK